MRKSLATIGITASLLGGSAVGATLFTPNIVSAQTDDTSTTEAETDEARPAFGDRIREVLAPLIEDGTLNQGQVDAVVETLEANKPEGRRGKGHGRGFHLTAEVLETLGLDASTVREGLKGGQSLADIATANGVEPQAVIDALVAEAQTKLDGKVADGSMTQEDADAKLAEITEKITERVNTAPDFEAREGRRGFGPRGGGADAEDTVDA